MYPPLHPVVLRKPCTGDKDNIHAYAWKPSCSLAVHESSQVSGCKTSITLRFNPIREPTAASKTVPN